VHASLIASPPAAQSYATTGHRLKIGLLADNYPDSGGAGGIGTYTKIVAEELARLGHDAHVFTPAQVPVHRVRRANGINLWECPDWTKRRDMPRLNALEFTLRHFNRAEYLGRYSLRVAVRRACKTGVFDLIESPEFGALGSLVSSHGYCRRLAVRLHKPLNLPFRYPGAPPTPAWAPIDGWERDLALSADVITVPTRDALRAISEFWGRPLDRAKVVGSPMDHYPWAPVAPVHPHSAVFFGRLEPRKGADTLARAIPIVRKLYPDFVVTFIGNNVDWEPGKPGADLLRSIAREAGVEDALRLAGQIQHSKLAALVRESAVCVLPSRAETFGVAFAEAMMWGVPCIASDIGPFRELAVHGEHCLFAGTENPAEFAQHIITLLSNPAQAATMASNAYTHVQQWITDKVVGQLLNAWEVVPSMTNR
jgi:glycosyltransferase involved in cell wall biosynthesis